MPGPGQGGRDLVAQRRRGPPAGPPVAEQLHDALAALAPACTGTLYAPGFLRRRALHAHLARGLYQVEVHAGWSPATRYAGCGAAALTVRLWTSCSSPTNGFSSAPASRGYRSVARSARWPSARNPGLAVDRLDHSRTRSRPPPLGERHQPRRWRRNRPPAGDAASPPDGSASRRAESRAPTPSASSSHPSGEVEQLSSSTTNSRISSACGGAAT